MFCGLVEQSSIKAFWVESMKVKSSRRGEMAGPDSELMPSLTSYAASAKLDVSRKDKSFLRVAINSKNLEIRQSVIDLESKALLRSVRS